MAADVDRLSHGRLLLGLGMGDQEIEFQRLGIPVPPVRQRQRGWRKPLHQQPLA
jgi:alkanesulfonate monooxygenase SsuD/methylene tetrahydromethanopterin reductase-like flavin-dependent oxidoreductase (luciferase family)